MGIFTGVNSLILLGVGILGAAVRLISLAIALRGTTPAQRPAIIRALADFFRFLPRKRT